MAWRNLSKRRRIAVAIVVIAAAILVYMNTGPRPGHVVDEARAANRDAASFPAADEDYFAAWTAPSRSRPTRSRAATPGSSGPAATTASGTDGPAHYGQPRSSENPYVLSGAEIQPGQPVGIFRPGQRAVFRQGDRSRSEAARAVAGSALARLPARSVRKRAEVSGRGDRRPRQEHPGGLVLRLRQRHRRAAAVPNPDFDEAPPRPGTRSATTPIPSYYNRKDLVRPYRVGMACGFCHVGPDPVKPPADAENPKWENLSSSNVGAQYFWVDRIFDWDADPRPSSSS